MKRCLFIAVILMCVSLAYAEDTPLPDTYRSLTLGMDVDSVKEQLKKDSLFGYRGDRDVSLLHSENRVLIETAGPSFIARSWFQFHEDHLYVMIFRLNTERIDYYSMYTTLVKKYGEPDSLDPRRALWSDERVTLTLERPLTVKYVDNVVFAGLIEADTTGRAMSDVLREEFLSDF